MAKTGINIEKCNVYKAEKHNGRDQAYIDAVNKSKKIVSGIVAAAVVAGYLVIGGVPDLGGDGGEHRDSFRLGDKN